MGLGVVFLGLLSAPRGAVGQVPSGVTVAVDGPPTVAAGEVFTWSVTVRNAAARSRRNVVVVDTLPAQATVVAISGGGVESGGVIRWPPIASLPVGGPPVVLTVTVQAPAGAATLTNTAVVLSAQPNLDGPKVASFTTVVAAGPPPPPPPSGADLSILKTGPPVVASEGTLTYALTVRNAGPDPAVDVVVEDVLPSAGRFVGASGGGTHAGGVIRWPVIPLLAPGAQRTFTVEFQAPTGPSQLTNRATVRSGTSDPVPTNDTSSVRTTVEPPVPPEIDVGVTATGPLSVPAGGLVTYTVEVVNTRSVPARGVSLQFQLPPNAAFVSASGGAILNGALLAWPPIAVLPVGGRLRFTITVRAPGTGTLEGIAIVTTPGDVDPANDTARVETRVQGSAGGSTDLEVRKSGPARVDPGAVAVYRIVARNRGAQSAFDVVVADTLPDPALAQFVSASPAPSAHPTPPAVIEWPALPVLGPGDSVVYEVRLRLPVPGARVADIASVRSSTPDSDPTNDADTAVTETGGASTGSTRLQVTKEAGRSEAQVGDVVQYRIDVEAEGVPGVDVQDLLPPGFLYVPGSTRIGGTIAADPTPAAGGWLDFGTFPTDPVTGTLRLTLTYRAEIGPSAPVGEGVNRVRVRGGPTTEESEARVRVRGAFREEGVIVGSVFLDCGCDPAQLDGEPGIPGVRVYLQDGTAAITDSDGRYSLYGLRPRNWIVRVDRSTLPAGAALVRLSNRHSDDGVSALVDLTRGEMHRADFGVTRSERLAGEIEARRRQPQVTSALPAPAPVLVRGTTFRSLVPATEGPVGVPGPLAPPDPAMPAAAGLDSTAVPGAVQAEVERDLPAPEPLALSGLLEARIDLRSSGVALAGADAFQDRLTRLTWSDDTHERTAGARGSLFAHGALGDGYTVTARLDTEPIPDVRVFRDIEPDAFYPVWGDASLSRFGARSTSRFFGEVRRGASSLTYGDFRTGPALAPGAVALGAYDRVLTGAIQHLETERVQVDAFARRGRSSRVVDEIPARGVSGPYSLSRADGLLHSELVEIVTYDRNQPGRVVAVERLERFQDYTLEPFTGRLLLRRPVPAVDAALNPLVLRVGYEVEGDTDAFWTVGGFAQVRAHDRVELGGGWIRDDDPVGRFDLASVNAAVEVLDATYLIGELARRDGGASGRQGDAGRVELRHRSDRVALDAFFVGTDPDFENPTSVFRAGRREAGLRSVTA
ncbi:MAG: DUF11 domain-containing protein, partial [Gemmatimonadetes bacterium]|nr:DUF11 domain-containing protein [Gemmatimonadota bacterium]